MNVLVACEESQRVCLAFRERGHNAFSSDLKPCSGGREEFHIMGDCFKIINGGIFETQDGEKHFVEKWDLIIAHPPCTFLTLAANRMHSVKKTKKKDIAERTMKRIEAISFFMRFVLLSIDKIVIENPLGVMSTVYRKPDQIIDPFEFAESENDNENYVTKRTCLWIRGLPLLKGKEVLDKQKGCGVLFGDSIEHPVNENIYGRNPSGSVMSWTEMNSKSAEIRSRTFPGIATAMAEQWG